MTGFTVGSNVAISSSDTILSAFGKTQAQLNNKLSLSGGTLSGTLKASGQFIFESNTSSNYREGARFNIRGG